MEFLKLITFLTVARTGSFHLAADELFLTPSAVSKHISYLEDTYRVVLFHRFSKGVKLTKSGELFLPYAERILSEHRHFLDALAAQESPKTVRLCAIPPQAMVFPLSKLFSQFEIQFPEYQISVGEEHGGQISRLLAEGYYHLGLCGDRYLDDGLVEWRVLSRSRVIALVNREHPLAGRECISLAELVGEPFISLPMVTGVLSENRKICQSIGMEYRIGIITEREENIVSYVARNAGVALIGNEYKNDGFLDRHGKGKVVPLILQEDINWNFVLAKGKKVTLPAAAAALWSLAREYGQKE